MLLLSLIVGEALAVNEEKRDDEPNACTAVILFRPSLWPYAAAKISTSDVSQRYLHLRLAQSCIFGWIMFPEWRRQPEEPSSNAYLLQKKNCRETIDELCDAYLIVLPKLMGCLVCQYAHSFANTERYLHMAERKAEIEKLKAMLVDDGFNPQEVLAYIENTMCPFKGEFGQSFHKQCKLLLTNLTKQWQ